MLSGLYHVFRLSLRDVELLLAERGLTALPTACGAFDHVQAISGTSTRCSRFHLWPLPSRPASNTSHHLPQHPVRTF